MATSSLPKGAPSSTREERGIRLAEEHFDSILRSWRPGGLWKVPGAGGKAWDVYYSRNGEGCTCPDFRHRKSVCKHLYAAAVVAAKSAICCGCGRRVRKSEIRDVPEDSSSLTYFGGERLCRRCWQDSDVVW